MANGYTDVNINNASGYDLYIERIDTTTNKEGRIQITDTSTGAVRTYHNSLGTPFQPIQDTAAFDTCP